MSDSSDKPISASRRQPGQRRQRPRQIPKLGQKKANNQQQQGISPPETTAITRLSNTPTSKLNPGIIPSGSGGLPRSGVTTPIVKKVPITKGKIPPFQPNSLNLRTVRVEKKGVPKVQRRYSHKTRLKPMARTLLYGLRLVIVGVGIGAIIGTFLSVFDPANRLNTASLPSSPNHIEESQFQSNSHPPATIANLYLSQELTPLKTSVQNLASANTALTPGVFFLDLDNGAYLDLNSSVSFPAASTIKVPILIAFFQDVEAGKIRLDEMLTVQQEMIAGGSGNLQYEQAGSKFSAMEIVTKMITISDNTATNMLIAKLGGKEALNQRFRSWGLVTTAIRNPLPDLAGTNTTSPKELGSLMALISQGSFVSMRSRDLMLDIMRHTQRDNLLPSGLGNGSEVYHKTGDIATLLADAGLVDVPTGKRYVAAVMVKRPNNDPQAEKLISSISRVAYQYFSQASVTLKLPPNNSPTITYQPPVQQPIQQPPVQPMIAPVIPDGTMNTIPIPPMNYQPPVTTPLQPYPQPYQYPQPYPQQ